MHLPSRAVLLALLGFALAGPALAGDADKESDAFFSSTYDYCDAKLLGAYWGADVYEAKLRIGRKIGWGDTAILEQMLGSARTQAQTRGAPTCTYHEAGYTYQDAEAIARLWGIAVADAKASMEYKINSGNEDLLKAELARAGGGAAAPASDEDAAFARFANSRYCYCDARVLGTYWGGDAWLGKITIGRKLGGNNRAILDTELAAAREQALTRGETCQFYETNYTSADATALATAWKLPITQAKAKVGNLVMRGEGARVRAALGKRGKAPK